jgi:hypothetical protein
MYPLASSLLLISMKKVVGLFFVRQGMTPDVV